MNSHAFVLLVALSFRVPPFPDNHQFTEPAEKISVCDGQDLSGYPALT
jgi:hypothetical protein